MRWFSNRPPPSRWPDRVPEFSPIPFSGPLAAAPWPDRHNSPNLADQLARPNIDTVICSALDSESQLRLNAAIIARRREAVVRGIRELTERTGARRAWLAVETGAPGVWLDPIRSISAGIGIIELPNDYPQSDPTMLLGTLAGRELKPGELPSSQGVVLVDAAGAATVGGHPLVPLGVLDHATGAAFYLEAAPGATLAAALSAAGVRTTLREARAGDPLRQRPARFDQKVGAGEICLHLLTPVEPLEVQACIRCGWCADVCPARVKPAWVLEAVQRGDARLARAGRGEACIECGLCDQECPSRLPLLAAIKQFKSNETYSKSIPL